MSLKRTITADAMKKKRRTVPKRSRRTWNSIPIGMPEMNLVKLRYCTSLNLNPAAGLMTSHYFSANGMFDPDISGIGHQPLFFDQYMASYDHFRVLEAEIKVTQLPEATDGSVTPVLWGIVTDDNTSLTYGSPAELIESNQSNKGKFRIGSQVANANHTSGKNPVITVRCDLKKFFGGDLNSTHDGTKAANPTDQAYFGVWCAGVGSVGDPPTMTFMVEITYLAEIKEPHFVAQS